MPCAWLAQSLNLRGSSGGAGLTAAESLAAQSISTQLLLLHHRRRRLLLLLVIATISGGPGLFKFFHSARSQSRGALIMPWPFF